MYWFVISVLFRSGIQRQQRFRSNSLNSTSSEAQALVLIMNEQGDHQMETYFNNPSGSNNGGMFCEDERTGPKMQQAFRKIDAIHNHSFKVTGGSYTKQEYERTCAIRLARTLFFEVKSGRYVTCDID